ncbi:MAG: hypothetical protein U1F36_06395 [Planctomycetota bacterium]
MSAVRSVALVVALLCAAPLQSCFTMVVWGVGPDGADVLADSEDDPAPWTWRTVGTRLLLTPFALALDCVTLPVQAAVFGWDSDEDDDHHERRHRDHDHGTRRHRH